MSRPAMPYRSTHAYQGNGHLIHHDFATKEERAKWWAGSCFGVRVAPRFTTVTSRKPLKPGTPVCWVNVYEDSDGKRAGGFTYRTEGAAALSAGSAAIHCIPVYLPGEGEGRSMCPQEELNEALAEVERLTKELAAAQAQAMPAGKVVYGASGKFGINRVFQTIEFADKRLRDTYRKADGWTWFTRVEES